MSRQLGAFLDEFAAALHGGTGPAESRQPGFAVYRNTVIGGCVDALQRNFPTVDRLVGGRWFRDVAAVYARRHPPTERSLLRYGAGFADFLAGFAPAAELPYLPGVAWLDYGWLMAHVAADEPALAPGEIEYLPAEQLASIRLVPLASARWAWFAGVPVYSIWDAHRRGKEVPQPLGWRGEGALLLRPQQEVLWMSLGRDGCAFLEACRSGRTLAEAAIEAGSSGTDVATTFARLLRVGAFARNRL